MISIASGLNGYRLEAAYTTLGRRARHDESAENWFPHDLGAPLDAPESNVE
jgi:hypothetical protein